MTTVIFPSYGNVVRISSGMSGLRYSMGEYYFRCSEGCTLGCSTDITVWPRTIANCSYEELFERMRLTCERGDSFCRNQYRFSLSAVFDYRRHAAILRLFFACGFTEFYSYPSFVNRDISLLRICLANNAQTDMKHHLSSAIEVESWSQVKLLTAANVVLLTPLIDLEGFREPERIEVAYRRIVHTRSACIERRRRALEKERRLVEIVRFQLIQKHAFAICVALQSLELPALVTLFLLDAVFQNFPAVQVHLKYRFITLIKHFAVAN